MKRSTKKVVAILLVAMFMLTLLPMTGFAASTNSVDRVPRVTVDTVFAYGATGAEVEAPVLRITENPAETFSKDSAAPEVFRLVLEKAHWGSESDIETGISAASAGHMGIVSVDRLTNTTIQVSVYAAGGTDAKSLRVPLQSTAKEAGEVKVTIEPRDSRVSAGTFTYAIVGVGETVATISPVRTFAGSVTLGAIEIDELIAGTLTGADQEIRFRLPRGFEWDTALAPDGYNLAEDFGAGTIDGRDVTYTGTVTGSGIRGTLVFSGLRIKATADANFGDVVITIRGDKLTNQDLLVARYADYGVTVTADAPREVMAGRWDSDSLTEPIKTGVHRLQDLVIEETAAGGWLAERRTRISFPAGVKVVGVSVVGADSSSDVAGTMTNELQDLGTLTGSALGKNFVEYVDLSIDRTVRTKVSLRFFVSVQSNYTGDITATVTGPGVYGETFDVVLGEAVAPVTLASGSADLRIGLNNQPIGDITITETQSEAIIQGGNLTVSLASGLNWNAVPTIEVTAGDLDLDVAGATRADNVLTIPVRGDSSQASTIRISNARVNIDRTVAEGLYNVSVGGSALVVNHFAPYTASYTQSQLLSMGLFNSPNVASVPALSVVTPAPGEVTATTTFTIGEMTYTTLVGGVEVEHAMDVAPYITDGRTMLPVRYVAYALGVTPGNILWDPASLTVTIFKGDRIVQLVIHSNNLLVNGVNVTMDVAPVTVDGRTMLPVRWVAQAFGAQVDWDAVTQTVTVTQ